MVESNVWYFTNSLHYSFSGYTEASNQLSEVRRENAALSDEIKDIMEQISEGGRRFVSSLFLWSLIRLFPNEAGVTFDLDFLRQFFHFSSIIQE